MGTIQRRKWPNGTANTLRGRRVSVPHLVALAKASVESPDAEGDMLKLMGDSLADQQTKSELGLGELLAHAIGEDAAPPLVHSIWQYPPG